MKDTTTIEIRDDQLEQLKTMKRVDRESYKSVLDRLLEGDTDTDSMQVVPVEDVTGVLSDFSDIPEQEQVDLEKVLDGIPEYDLQDRLDRIESALGDSRNLVQLEATEYRKIADEVEGRLR